MTAIAAFPARPDFRRDEKSQEMLHLLESLKQTLIASAHFNNFN